MPPLFRFLAAALLALTSSLVLADRSRINVVRYTEDCFEEFRIDAYNESIQLGTKEGCYTWEDKKEFGAIAYGWTGRTRPDDFIPGHRNETCTISMYHDVECGGTELGHSDLVNRPRKTSRCIADFEDKDGNPGEAKSVCLECTRL